VDRDHLNLSPVSEHHDGFGSECILVVVEMVLRSHWWDVWFNLTNTKMSPTVSLRIPSV